MPLPALTWWNSSDTVQQTAGLTFAPVNGTPTAEQTVHLHNDKGGALSSDTADDLELTVLTRDAGSSDAYSETHAVAAAGYVEIRVTGQGGAGDPTPQTLGWTASGGGRWVRLSALPSAGWRAIGVRVNIPAGVGAQSCEVLIRPRYAAKSDPLPAGLGEAGANGIRSGLGDASYSALWSGGAVTPSGSPDDEVHVAAFDGVLAGVATANPGEDVALSQSDGNAVALGVGQAYYATLYAASDGSVGVAKAAKATAPLTPDALPSTPNGEPILADVNVDYDAGGGAIAAGDISFARRIYGAFALESSASSLDVTVHGGDGFVGGYRVRLASSRTITLSASSTTYLWRTIGGEVSTSATLAQPSDGALVLYRLTTNGSGVTAVLDLRVWSSSNRSQLLFSREGDLTAGDLTAVAIVPQTMSVLSVAVALNTSGTGAGSTIIDLERSESGGAWTSLYPSSGTRDIRPTIASAASDPTARAGIPESPVLLAGTRLRAKVAAVPGTTEPNGLAVVVSGEALVS